MVNSNRNWRAILNKTGRVILIPLYFLVELFAIAGGASALPSDYIEKDGKQTKSKPKASSRDSKGNAMPLWLTILLILLAIILFVSIGFIKAAFSV